MLGHSVYGGALKPIVRHSDAVAAVELVPP